MSSRCLARSRVTQFRLILVCGGPSSSIYFFLPRLFVSRLYFSVLGSSVVCIDERHVVGCCWLRNGLLVCMLPARTITHQNPKSWSHFVSGAIPKAVVTSGSVDTKVLTCSWEGKLGNVRQPARRLFMSNPSANPCQPERQQLGHVPQASEMKLLLGVPLPDGRLQRDATRSKWCSCGWKRTASISP